ncbi:ATPase family AAA domain-containing protein 2 isoform X1 [Ixodes scapularis]|uniref:ATPase family AAA domain-containing protein 2 isoform X1 n=1 Tax=Ixodes scapularis TaxID=6945 RepID=UPI001A9DF206|nr:ATPase family AAA domain-containing protein 2 isoform X1 [Ixodes scapularis]
MVNTRNSSLAAERSTTVPPRHAGRNTIVEAQNSEESSDDEESSHELSSVPTRSAKSMSQVVEPSGLTNGRHHPSLRSRVAHARVIVSSDDDMNEGEDDDSMVRRSKRRRKCIYDNLNQSWILTSNVPEFVKASAERSSTRSKTNSAPFHHLRSSVTHNICPVGANDSRMLDGDNEDSLESKQSHDKSGSRELRQLEPPEMAGTFSDDMYSRVKRTRQQHRDAAPPTRSFFKSGQSSRRSRRGDRGEAGEEGGEGASDTDGAQGSSDAEVTELGDTEDEGPLPTMNGYHLRPKKPVTERFQVPVEATKRSKRITSIFHTPKHNRMTPSFKSPAHRPIYRSKRHATHNSSSTSSSSDDERRFERRKARSMVRARNHCLPLNFQEKDLVKGVLRDRAKIGCSLADVDPMQVDKEVTFDRVGGLDGHLEQLKEMILFPLIYPEVFDKFKITPPRGVLFHGPPGTGKTLVARALANECSRGDRRVAFFMRKGADCLSKWVGESERQLRMLFDQAYSMRPSIIFFDEIDGLAPVRSTRQDQIHSSIVSTLLALMDGLDSRGEVVVIGATNRVDAIDPALRRPGRFDREFHFALPCHQARLTILEIHTRDWVPPPGRPFLSELSARCTGYCGADLKALCAEAALAALRRSFPQIYASKEKLQLNIDAVRILPEDYERAMRKIVPAAQRCAATPARPLSLTVRPLLCAQVERALAHLRTSFALGLRKSPIAMVTDGSHTDDGSVFSEDDATSRESGNLLGGDPSCMDASDATKLIPSVRSRFAGGAAVSHRPRLLICGRGGLGQTTHVAPAVLHLLEHLPLHRMDLPSLHAVTARAPEEACAQVFLECQRVLPGVLYLPHLCQWWDTLGEAVRATFVTLLQDLEPLTPVLWLATADVPFEQLPPEVQRLFGPSEVLELSAPTAAERRLFFAPVFAKAASVPGTRRPTPAQMPPLPPAPPPELRKLTPAELDRLRQQEDATLRELRLFLRDILTKLQRDRRYAMFAKPVDASEVPDYHSVIAQPMDLETMMVKVDLHQYHSVAEFLGDVDLICSNALEYNPDRDPTDKNIRHRAYALQDAAHALVDTELDWEFEKICQGIVQARKERGEEPVAYVPKNYHVVPRQPPRRDSDVNEVAHLDAPSEDGGNKRFSRRIRGLHVSSDEEEAPKAAASGHATTDGATNSGRMPLPPRCEVSSKSTPTSQSEPSGRRAYAVVRRRKSPWFGCHSRRRIRLATTQYAPATPKHPSSTGKAARARLKRRRLSSEHTVPKETPTACTSPSSSLNTTVPLDVTLPPATEVPACSVEQAAVSSPDKAVEVGEASNHTQGTEVPRQLHLDRRRLKEIEDEVLSLTEGCSVETLERLHCSLLNAVRRHRSSWDRGPLLADFTAELERFQSLLKRLPRA